MVIRVPTAATCQVVKGASGPGESWLVTRTGTTVATARLNDASQTGMTVGLVGHRLMSVATR